MSPETFLWRRVYLPFQIQCTKIISKRQGPVDFILLTQELCSTTPSGYHSFRWPCPRRSHPLVATPSGVHAFRWPLLHNAISFRLLYLKVPSLVYNQSLIWLTGLLFGVWKDVLLLLNKQCLPFTVLASLEIKASIHLNSLLYAFWWMCVYIL